MIKILFICHGNICRSTMAQFVFSNMVKKLGLENLFLIDSAATSNEEIGNPPHIGTVRKLKEEAVPVLYHRARRVTVEDYDDFDLLIIMDEQNRRNLFRIIKRDPENKVHTLLSYANMARDIADPWWTGDFDECYSDINTGCAALLEYLLKNGKV